MNEKTMGGNNICILVKYRRILSLNDRDIQTLSLSQTANQNQENKRSEKSPNLILNWSIFGQFIPKILLFLLKKLLFLDNVIKAESYTK
jgi:hypothetical protein